MPDVAKKGITVKVTAELHAEVSEYIRSHGMTMSELPSSCSTETANTMSLRRRWIG